MKIYPVIHMQSPEHALTLSKQAFGAGADGVFVIDHVTYQTPEILTETYQHLREELGQTAWIGVNYLNLFPNEAALHLVSAKHSDFISQMPDGLWADDAISTAGLHDVPALKSANLMEDVAYFGGIAFKYTRHYTDDPAEAAAQAVEYASMVDVVTTSGAGTGISAKVDKVAAMKQAMREAGIDKPLALASGVTIDNIRSFGQAGLDIVLAASSIETGKYSGVFNLYKMYELIHAAHEIE
ncbi:MAG: hypothetical protein ABIP74_02320 [Candidatus Saccharimonas sp.]